MFLIELKMCPAFRRKATIEKLSSKVETDEWVLNLIVQQKANQTQITHEFSTIEWYWNDQKQARTPRHK